MWTVHTDRGVSSSGGQSAKNIYLGEVRIVTKLNSYRNPTKQEEAAKQYYYHSDHLGSASMITDNNGKEYERLEYTPYGELWVEHTTGSDVKYLPYKFTGKEMDEETGLYYYGARYLDPKYSRWLSTDPALGEYIPEMGKGNAKDSGNLPGMGGVYNHINFHLYHYAGNNPVRYVDPDGRQDDENNLISISQLDNFARIDSFYKAQEQLSNNISKLINVLKNYDNLDFKDQFTRIQTSAKKWLKISLDTPEKIGNFITTLTNIRDNLDKLNIVNVKYDKNEYSSSAYVLIEKSSVRIYGSIGNKTLVLCDGFFFSKNKDSILMHEMSHYVLDTNDISYKESDLPKLDRNNASNWMKFYEDSL